MGANIECDHRVPTARFAQLASIPVAGPLYADRRLQVGVTDYASKFNYNTATPAFLSSLNDVNIRLKMTGAVPLVSVFQFKKRQSSTIAQALNPGLVGSTEFSQLCQELKRLFPDDRPTGLGSTLNKSAIDFLDRFFTLQWSGGRNQYHGVWAGRWREFEALAETNAATWMSAMGVRIPAEPSLCLLLRYDASEVYPLVRPTILEAGWYPEHFPSPQSASWCVGKPCPPTGGHPMGLDDGTPALALRAEYVHRDRERKSSWVYAWAWVQPASTPSITLPSARRRHWELLKGHYDRIEDWLSEP